MSCSIGMALRHQCLHAGKLPGADMLSPEDALLPDAHSSIKELPAFARAKLFSTAAIWFQVAEAPGGTTGGYFQQDKIEDKLVLPKLSISIRQMDLANPGSKKTVLFSPHMSL